MPRRPLNKRSVPRSPACYVNRYVSPGASVPPKNSSSNGSIADDLDKYLLIALRSVPFLALDVGWTDEKDCFGWHDMCCPKSSESQHLTIV